eukprot:g59065.t1
MVAALRYTTISAGLGKKASYLSYWKPWKEFAPLILLNLTCLGYAVLTFNLTSHKFLQGPEPAPNTQKKWPTDKEVDQGVEGDNALTIQHPLESQILQLELPQTKSEEENKQSKYPDPNESRLGGSQSPPDPNSKSRDPINSVTATSFGDTSPNYTPPSEDRLPSVIEDFILIETERIKAPHPSVADQSSIALDGGSIALFLTRVESCSSAAGSTVERDRIQAPPTSIADAAGLTQATFREEDSAAEESDVY